jgi:hypothetical protein
MELMGIVLGVGFFSAFVLSCWLTVLGSMHIFSLWDRLSGPAMLPDLLSYPIILFIAIGLSLVSAGCLVLNEYFLPDCSNGGEGNVDSAREVAAKKALATLIDEWTLSQKASVRLFFGTD